MMAMPYYHITIDSKACDRCGKCVPACPRALIRMAGRWQINWLECDGCGKCSAVCPRDAVRVARLEPAGARREAILYLPPATGSVLSAVAAVAERARRGDLDAVVVASLPGSTAVLLARALEEYAGRLVCVADTPDWVAFGHPYPTLDERHHRELLARGARILRDYRSTSAGMPRFDPAAGQDAALTGPESALFWEGVAAVGGEGLKTAVKSAVLATDYGLLRVGERVAALGGTGGREAAVVMDAIGHAGILAGAPGTHLRVREILCLPAPT